MYEEWLAGCAAHDLDNTTGEEVTPPNRYNLEDYFGGMRVKMVELFRGCVEFYFPLLCGKKMFDHERLMAEKTVAQILHVSDEAFFLLMLENCWDHWMYVAEKR